MNNNRNKLVSVALCTYNGEKYIDQQIQSIINQDYPSIEIIISDDKSTDNTLKLLNNWKRKYPEKISFTSNELNIGFNKNFEKVIRSCNGEYIAIADQDDVWHPNKISRLVELLIASKAVLVHSASVNFNKKKYNYRYGVLKRTILFEGTDTRSFFFHNHIQGHNILFKKELKEKIFPFPDNVFYDHWIAAVATTQEGGIKALNEYLVNHRVHGTNAYYSAPRNYQNELQNLAHFFDSLNTLKDLPGSVNLVLKEAQFILQEKLKNKLGKFDPVFFRFLYRNRNLFFGYKKRRVKLIKEWSMLKSCYKLAKH